MKSSSNELSRFIFSLSLTLSADAEVCGARFNSALFDSNFYGLPFPLFTASKCGLNERCRFSLLAQHFNVNRTLMLANSVNVVKYNKEIAHLRSVCQV